MENNTCIICREPGGSIYSLPCGRIYYKEPAYAGFENMMYSEAHIVHLQDVGYKEFNVCDRCAAGEYKKLFRLRPVTGAPDSHLTIAVFLMAIAPAFIISAIFRFSFLTGLVITVVFFILFMYLFMNSNKKKIETDSKTEDGKLKGVYSLLSKHVLDEKKEMLINKDEAENVSCNRTITVERTEINYHMVLLKRVLIFAAGLFASVLFKAILIKGGL